MEGEGIMYIRYQSDNGFYLFIDVIKLSALYDDIARRYEDALKLLNRSIPNGTYGSVRSRLPS